MNQVTFVSPNILKSSFEGVVSVLSPRDLKITAFALLLFAGIGFLVWQFLNRKKETLLPIHIAPTIQRERQQDSLQVKQQTLLPSVPDKQPELDSSSKEALPAIPPIENQPLVQEIPPLPSLDFSALFAELAQKTKAVDCFPHTEENCRFTNVLCPKNTHVKAAGDSVEIYLHANHVELEGIQFIATQYPHPIHFPLFWRTCRDVCLAIDLTNQKDMRDRSVITYCPKLNESKNCADLTVTCKKETKVEELDASLYSYQVEDQSTDKYQVARLHYQGWNDFQGIGEDDSDQIISIMEEHQKDPSRPILVHCRAGVGRTGTIIILYVLKRLIDQKKVDAGNLKEHLFRLILKGREQRGDNFVQSLQQFIALWKWSWRALHREL